MNDRLRESLSALMDDEASELEMHRLLKSMERDPSLRDTWAGYHQSRDIMHGHGDAQHSLQIDISAAVQDAIADEPSYGHQPIISGPLARLKKSLGGFAVAASVAGAVFIGGQALQFAQGSSPSEAVVAQQENSVVVDDGNVVIEDDPRLILVASDQYQQNDESQRLIEAYIEQQQQLGEQVRVVPEAARMVTHESP